MAEQLVTLETAKLAKQKGFDWETHESFIETLEHSFEDRRKHEEVIIEYKPPRVLPTNFADKFDYCQIVCYAPSQALLQKWLREEHDIHVYARLGDLEGGGVYFVLYFNNKNPKDTIMEHWSYESYEQALEKGLQEALKLIEL